MAALGLVNEILVGKADERKTIQSDNRVVALERNEDYPTAIGTHTPDNRTANPIPSSPRAKDISGRSVHIEEIEDEEWENQARMPKATRFTVEDASLAVDDEEGDRKESLR